MKIKKLTAKNFRLFTDLEINFPDENFICLIGNNGSGKSAILDAVNMTISTFIIYNTYNYLDEFRKKYLTNWQNENDIKIIKENYHVKTDFNFTNKDCSSEVNLKRADKIIFTPQVISNKDAEQIDKITSSVPIWLYFDVKRLEKLGKDYNEGVFSNELLNTYNHLLSLKNKNSNLSLKKFEEWYISYILREFITKGKENKPNFELQELSNVRTSITNLFKHLHSTSYKNLSVSTNEPNNPTSWDKLNSHVTLVKESDSENDYELKLSQLSSGEKMVTFMVAEIARKLTIANENKAEALKGKGVVLIDELDLHLHPNWQRNIVGALKATFPNVQFITTTHSPQVLSSLKASEIIEIDGDKVYSPSVNPYGRDSNNILSNVMNDGARPKEIDKLINSIFMNFAEDKNDTAIEQFEQLKPNLSDDDPIIGRIESIIKRKEILNS